MAKIIAFSNFKGGVGKTTSTLNIGAAMASMGKKVLLIDLDPQFNLTRCLGIRIESGGESIYGALFGNHPPPIVERSLHFHLIPSNIELIKAETELVSQFRREEKLNSILIAIKHTYDYVLIDCPPSLGVLSQMAFASADIILVPVQAEFLALAGYEVLSDALLRIGIEIDGAFLTQYDKRQSLDRGMLESLKNIAKDKALNSIIRQNVSIAESSMQGQTVFEYAPQSMGAMDYKALTIEILSKF
jgi:chromosome partitioning protein